jgi:hypothetical protein
MKNDPVTNGRDALNRWNAYPWYDTNTDGIRRVEVSQPWDFDFATKASPGWSTPSSGVVLQWMAWTLIGALLAGAIYLFVRAYRQRIRQTTRKERPKVLATVEQIEALPAPALVAGNADFLAETRRCYEAGDYSRAIVYYFSYQLIRLDKRQRIVLASGKTNRQYLRELQSSPSLRALVDLTVTAFEDVFFGHRSLDRYAFDRCWARLDEFEGLVEGGER